jgi:DNA-binding transcriptional regulator YdaS (Cro superfamily)
MLDLSQGVKAAIKSFGTQTALADALGIERSAISQWKQVPATRVLEIEEKTGGTVSRHEMRPDVFGPPPSKKRARAGA